MKKKAANNIITQHLSVIAAVVPMEKPTSQLSKWDDCCWSEGSFSERNSGGKRQAGYHVWEETKANMAD